jgi:hypothetical protein
MITMPSKMGPIVSASDKHMEFECGTFHIGDKVKMPRVAGRRIGTVDSISLELDESTGCVELVLRIVDSTGKGHQFRFGGS